MSSSEKKALTVFIAALSAFGAATLTFGVVFENGTAIVIGSILAAMAVLVGFFGLVQFCADALRDYGLGEGTEQLYGKAHAQRMFGENYRKPQDD